MLETSENAAIDITNGSVSSLLDQSTLFQVDVNSLLYTTKDNNFFIYVYETANHNSGRQHINDRYQVILLNYYKSLIDMDLMYMTTSEPSQWDINNPSLRMITLFQPWTQDFIGNEQEGRVIYTYYYEVADKIGNPSCYKRKLPLGIFTKYHVKSRIKATDQLVSEILWLILRRHYNYWFTHMNYLQISMENSTGFLF